MEEKKHQAFSARDLHAYGKLALYLELELNLRIKPIKRLIREKPNALAIPMVINECWSMDFMRDHTK
jgi:hypothetical protein